MPRIMPDDRYFSMPSTEVGADVRRNRALNCWPWVRSSTVRCGRVAPRILEGPEARAAPCHRGQDIQQVASRAGEPGEPRHHQHVARLKAPDNLGKLRSIAARSAGLLTKNLGASRDRQFGH